MISDGNYLFPAGALTTARDVFGSAILVALSAVAVLGIATILRRSSGAVVAGIACSSFRTSLAPPSRAPWASGSIG